MHTATDRRKNEQTEYHGFLLERKINLLTRKTKNIPPKNFHTVQKQMWQCVEVESRTDGNKLDKWR